MRAAPRRPAGPLRVQLLGCALFLLASTGAAMSGTLPPSPVDSAGAPAAAVDTAGASPGATPADSLDTAAQRDLFDVLARMLHRERMEPEVNARTKGIDWQILPSLSYNAVYGVALGASLSGSGWLGLEKHSHATAVSLSGSYSTTEQILAQLRGEIYSADGGYLLKPDLRYMDTNRSTWGLGPISSDQSEYPMDFRLLRFYATLMRRVSGPLYAGVGFHTDKFSEIRDARAVAGESTPFTEYSGGAPTSTEAVGLSLNLTGDTRNSLVNPKKGFLLAGSFRLYSKTFGSDDFWQEFLTEVRLYTPIPRQDRHILAFWLSYWFTYGNAPYLNLPAVGWDTYGRGGRGYKQGRIRAANMIYWEAEYRRELRQDGLLGGVIFLNSSFSTLDGDAVFARGDLAAGLGLRIKFSKHSDTNLVIDYGWGRGESRGLTLAMGEAF